MSLWVVRLFIWVYEDMLCWGNGAPLGFWAPRGVQRGVRGVRWGQKIKYGSKCLKLPNSSRKVVFSILKISGQNENFDIENICGKLLQPERTRIAAHEPADALASKAAHALVCLPPPRPVSVQPAPILKC